jgi:hypothetical protein
LSIEVLVTGLDVILDAFEHAAEVIQEGNLVIDIVE